MGGLGAEVLLHLLVDEECCAGGGDDPQQVGEQALVEGPQALAAVHICAEGGDALETVGVVDDLEPRTHDLQRVEDACGEHLGGRAGVEVLQRGQALACGVVGGGVAVVAVDEVALEDVVERQLHGALGDVEERRGEPAVVAEDALLRVDLAQAVEHGAVGARRRPLCGDHPGLDDPDGVGEHRRRPPGGKRRKKVVPRLQRAVPVQVCVLQHQVLVLPVEVEVERPRRRRPEQVGTHSAVHVPEEPGHRHLPRGGVRGRRH